MKPHFLCLIWFLFTSLGIQKPTSENDLNVTAIEKSLNDFSAALATADTISLKRLTGPTFVLLEEGRTYNFQAMILSIQQVLSTGAKMKRFPSNFHTEIRGSVAWSNYKVVGEFEKTKANYRYHCLKLPYSKGLEHNGVLFK